MSKYPDLTLSDLTKLIAKDWNELPRSSKKVPLVRTQPYLEKAEVDRQRYGDELGSYKDKKEGKKKKDKKNKVEQDEDAGDGGGENGNEKAGGMISETRLIL